MQASGGHLPFPQGQPAEYIRVKQTIRTASYNLL